MVTVTEMSMVAPSPGILGSIVRPDTEKLAGRPLVGGGIVVVVGGVVVVVVVTGGAEVAGGSMVTVTVLVSAITGRVDICVCV